MKCARCILEALVDIPLTPESMQNAIDGARTAVTSANGNAFCGEHLAIHIISTIAISGFKKPDQI